MLTNGSASTQSGAHAVSPIFSPLMPVTAIRSPSPASSCLDAAQSLKLVELG